MSDRDHAKRSEDTVRSVVGRRVVRADYKPRLVILWLDDGSQVKFMPLEDRTIEVFQGSAQGS